MSQDVYPRTEYQGICQLEYRSRAMGHPFWTLSDPARLVCDFRLTSLPDDPHDDSTPLEDAHGR